MSEKKRTELIGITTPKGSTDSSALSALSQSKRVAEVIEDLGDRPRLFTLDLEDGYTSVYSERPNEHVARIILAHEIENSSMLEIVDHAFVLNDNKTTRVRSIACPKTSEDLDVEAFMMEVWLYENAARIEQGLVGPYEIGPGTPWKTAPFTGPIIASDTSKGMVVINKDTDYEKEMVDRIITRTRDVVSYSSVLEIAETILPIATEYPINFTASNYL